MVSMTAEAASFLPQGRPFTRADRDALPDDGNRYELIDGVLVVTPAPIVVHQRVSMRLSVLLHPLTPAGCEVLAAPFDVQLGADTVVQPDLLLVRLADLTEKQAVGPPLLAVEILSRSTRHLDLADKKARYEAAGVTAYWVVDPEVPSIVAWELVDGAYVEVGRAVGDEALTLEWPVAVSVVPAQLV